MCKHRGVKDAKCDICGAAFVQIRDLVNVQFKFYTSIIDIL